MVLSFTRTGYSTGTYRHTAVLPLAFSYARSAYFLLSNLLECGIPQGFPQTKQFLQQVKKQICCHSSLHSCPTNVYKLPSYVEKRLLRTPFSGHLQPGNSGSPFASPAQPLKTKRLSLAARKTLDTQKKVGVSSFLPGVLGVLAVSVQEQNDVRKRKKNMQQTEAT